MLLQLAIFETVAYIGTFIGFKRADSSKNRQQALMDWQFEKSTPVLDGLLEKRCGSVQSQPVEKLANGIVSAAREIVNRKAFNQVVHGLLRPDSGISAWKNKLKGTLI